MRINKKKIRKKIKRYSLIIIFLLIFYLLTFHNQDLFNNSFFNNTIFNNYQANNTIKDISKENGSYELYFCPRDNCESHLMKSLNSSLKINCAFYDINLDDIKSLLKEKNASVLLFDDNAKKFNYATSVSSKGLMHNKFCILDDDTVITGSMNPTFNGVNKNNNNLFIIKSRFLAKNYNNEFAELKTKNLLPEINMINFTDQYNDTYIIENYFCPEDNCESKILKELNKAKSEIIFMTFTFTSDPIGNLLLKKLSSGVEVRGIFESRQKSKWWEYDKLLRAGALVITDKNPYTMHHKVFIIDDSTVIFGSMNPTKSGNEKNDENIIIIHNQEIAKLFIKEYKKIS